MIVSPVLIDTGSVRHGFFTREGGASTGIYASLNCGFGSGDERELVAENRARCAARLELALEGLVTAYQVHGVAAVEVETPWEPGAGPKADVMVTRRPGVALGILTADCAPVLAADAHAGIVGAAHAGWKGAKSGAAAAMVEAMVGLGADPSRIVAAVGPTIGLASYEVGAEFRSVFLQDDPSADRFFAADWGERPHFDLQGFVAARLEALGLGHVDRIAADTCADSGRFFSYRRACLAGEKDYGRQLSAIVLV